MNDVMLIGSTKYSLWHEFVEMVDGLSGNSNSKVDPKE